MKKQANKGKALGQLLRQWGGPAAGVAAGTGAGYGLSQLNKPVPVKPKPVRKLLIPPLPTEETHDGRFAPTSLAAAPTSLLPGLGPITGKPWQSPTLVPPAPEAPAPVAVDPTHGGATADPKLVPASKPDLPGPAGQTDVLAKLKKLPWAQIAPYAAAAGIPLAAAALLWSRSRQEDELEQQQAAAERQRLLAALLAQQQQAQPQQQGMFPGMGVPGSGRAIAFL